MAEFQERLEFGNLDLIPLDEAGPYTISVLSEGSTFGGPSPVTVQIRTLLADGGLSKTVSHDPREAYFKVQVEGMDSPSLGMGEAVLVGQTEKPNTLTWTPPDGESPPCVFEVIDSHLEPIFDDFDETNNIRTWGLRLTCMPFTRPKDMTVVDAVTSVGAVSTVQVDACTSITGWAGSGPVVTTTGGFVYTDGIGTSQPAPNGGVNNGRFLERTETVSMTGTPYLTVVSSRAHPSTNGKFQAYVLGGSELKIVAQTSVVAGSVLVLTTTFYCPLASFDKIKFTDTFIPPTTGSPVSPIGIGDITKTSVAPFVGTPRQKALAIDIGGTVRTQGSLAIVGATGLGEVLCYVRGSEDGSGYQPSLRIRRSGGGSTVEDATTVSGYRENISTQVSFAVPMADFPRGGYDFLGRFRPTTAAMRTITWTARCSLGGPIETGTATLTGVSIGSQLWRVVHLGVISGRTLKVPENSTATMNITLVADSALDFDDAWVFNMKLGELTWLNAQDRTRVWLDAPAIDLPEASVYRGNLASRADAHYPPEGMLNSWGRNQVRPGRVKADVITTDCVDAGTSFAYYKRFHTNVVA